uniref:Transmembrane protein n=1 Tax=Toxoplasma gondii (strain ATCC 50861 / VEG) TaxID=432359 RepID=A0A0F7VA00_TOXGV|nr:TPA: hypothetical protein BN1205_096640 [Toxoplasma gondii VEG]
MVAPDKSALCKAVHVTQGGAGMTALCELALQIATSKEYALPEYANAWTNLLELTAALSNVLETAPGTAIARAANAYVVRLGLVMTVQLNAVPTSAVYMGTVTLQLVIVFAIPITVATTVLSIAVQDFARAKVNASPQGRAAVSLDMWEQASAPTCTAAEKRALIIAAGAEPAKTKSVTVSKVRRSETGTKCPGDGKCSGRGSCYEGKGVFPL